MASRPAVLLLSIGVLAGCHAGTSGGLSPRPEPSLPRLSATQAIEKHNENAMKVVALQAQPSIVVTAPGTNGAKADGALALERPRNFKLVLKSMRGREADIGSNEDEFWFWLNQKADRGVYFCSYDDVDRTRLSAGFQPDWIVEAMGLRTISPDEARKMDVRPGDGPTSHTMKLISTRAGAGGSVLTKETIIDNQGRILEHRLYQGQGTARTLVASAVIERSQVVTAPDGIGTVVLPLKFRLDWVQERLTLDITLRDAQLLPGFSPTLRQLKFVEPDDANLQRTNLADAGPASAAPRARASADPAPRRGTSRSTPRVRSGVELGAPEPMSLNGPTPSRPIVAVASEGRSAPSDRPIEPDVRPELPRPDDR